MRDVNFPFTHITISNLMVTGHSDSSTTKLIMDNRLASQLSLSPDTEFLVTTDKGIQVRVPLEVSATMSSSLLEYYKITDTETEKYVYPFSINVGGSLRSLLNVEDTFDLSQTLMISSENLNHHRYARKIVEMYGYGEPGSVIRSNFIKFKNWGEK